MNKEQFKKSISNLVNYYIGNAMQLNDSANIAKTNDDDMMLKMIETQVGALNYSFEVALDDITNKLFPQGESEVNVSEVSGE